ncbi:MAG: D-3-phosphoglycerate dehydrogenase, partial [uncultured Thermomicrobiales bacterium]
ARAACGDQRGCQRRRRRRARRHADAGGLSPGFPARPRGAPGRVARGGRRRHPLPRTRRQAGRDPRDGADRAGGRATIGRLRCRPPLHRCHPATERGGGGARGDVPALGRVADERGGPQPPFAAAAGDPRHHRGTGARTPATGGGADQHGARGTGGRSGAGDGVAIRAPAGCRAGRPRPRAATGRSPAARARQRRAHPPHCRPDVGELAAPLRQCLRQHRARLARGAPPLGHPRAPGM